MDRERPLILMTDDSDDFRDIVVAKLQSCGFDVEVAKSGKEGVEKAHETKPDLILMDIRMPGEMNGIDAAFKIKEDPELKQVKIVFLSSLEDPWPAFAGDRSSVSKDIGMEDFILKTEDIDTIAEKVKGFLAPPAPVESPEAAPPPTPPAPPEASAPAETPESTGETPETAPETPADDTPPPAPMETQ